MYLNENMKEILSRAEDLVDKSKHYKGKIETIEYMRDKLTTEEFRGYLIGNVYKYLDRHNKKTKNPYEDLNKGFVYYLWLLETMIEGEKCHE